LYGKFRQLKYPTEANENWASFAAPLNATKHSVPPLPFFMEAIKIRLLAEQSRGEYINEIQWRIKYVRQAFKYTFSSALIIKEFSVLSRALIKFCSVLYCSVVWQKVAFWKSLVGSWRIWYHLYFLRQGQQTNHFIWQQVNFWKFSKIFGFISKCTESTIDNLWPAYYFVKFLADFYLYTNPISCVCVCVCLCGCSIYKPQKI